MTKKQLETMKPAAEEPMSDEDLGEPTAEAAEVTEMLERPKKRAMDGQRKFIYKGNADSFDAIPPFKIKPGIPFWANEELTEELLTWPFETFEEVKE